MKVLPDPEQIPNPQPKAMERKHILSPYSRMALRQHDPMPGNPAAEALCYYDYSDECIEEVNEEKSARP